MCLCTPTIRTPWCGKPGCTRPPQTADIGPDGVVIATPSDFPPDWHEKYLNASGVYRRSRLWENDKEADGAAFRDVRRELWRSLKPAKSPTSIE